MARNISYVVQKATKKTIKELQSIGESIYTKGIKKAMVDVAEEAVEIARSELLSIDPKFTSQQLSPQEAASEIQAIYKENDKTVTIVATLDYSKRNAMYFLEYGSGLSSEDPNHTKIPWIYKIRHADNIHEEVSQQEAYAYGDALVGQQASKYAYNKRLELYKKGRLKTKPRSLERYSVNEYETKVFRYKGSLYGITISSKAIGYMRAARRYVNRYASKKTAAAISVLISRRTNKPSTRLNYHYEPHGNIKDIY